MPITDYFTEKKIQRNLAFFLEAGAEYSAEQFEEMQKPFYGIMDAAKLRMNGKTEVLFFTEEKPLFLPLFETIDEDRVVEALGGLYYHLSVIDESDLLDSRNLMLDFEHIYFDIPSSRICFVYLPIRREGVPPRTGKFPVIGEKIAALIDTRFDAGMGPAMRALRDSLYESLPASEIYARVNALHPVRAVEEGERLRGRTVESPADRGRMPGGEEGRRNRGKDKDTEPGNSNRGKSILKNNIGKNPKRTINDMDGTVVEQKSEEVRIPKILQLTLRSPATGQQIMLEQNTLIIGRKTPEAMGMLTDAPKTVGREHAEITRVGDRFFIRDKNSRNGTTLNGSVLTPMELYPLSDGDKVSLARFELDVRVNEI